MWLLNSIVSEIELAFTRGIGVSRGSAKYATIFWLKKPLRLYELVAFTTDTGQSLIESGPYPRYPDSFRVVGVRSSPF